MRAVAAPARQSLPSSSGVQNADSNRVLDSCVDLCSSADHAVARRGGDHRGAGRRRPAGGVELPPAGGRDQLAPGATYVGNFVLPNKGALSDYITIRSAAPDAALPRPACASRRPYAAQLPKIRSSNNMSALRTAAAANHWKLMFLEFQANLKRLRRHHRARRRRLDADAARRRCRTRSCSTASTCTATR